MRTYLHLSLIVAWLSMPAVAVFAQTPVAAGRIAAPAIDGIPGPMTWQNPPAEWKIVDGKTLSITADKQTDWYVSAMGDEPRNNSPRLLFKPTDDFSLSAKVNVDFQSQWDGGVLVLYVNDSLFAKFCLEMTIEKHPAIVSVVTRGLSDDNNSIAVKGTSAYLKVTKVGHAIYFFASEDGQSWSLIRVFSLGDNLDLRVGFSSQAPVGDRCTTTFSQIEYSPRKVNPWTGK